MKKIIPELKNAIQKIKGKRVFFTAVIILIAIIFAGVYASGYSAQVNSELADNLIRLHVIANSDSEEDQELKREIRDAVIDCMDDRLERSKSIEQSQDIIRSNMDDIEKIAIQKIKDRGRDYPVTIQLGEFPFPTKRYSNVTLPAGYYQSLKVVIGKGKGSNWWCVLFPPLCFVDAAHGTIPDSVKEELKVSLTDEDYKMVISAESEKDIPVRIRFKIVELFQGSKIKFSGFFNRLFRSGR